MERDAYKTTHFISSIHFNSHAHVERDSGALYCSGCLSNFNSHAHVERDPSEEEYIVKLSDFNSHAHVERDSALRLKLFLHTHFNSHAHVERDYVQSQPDIRIDISTHTLTWSVTKDTSEKTGQITISTHTLTWSVTVGFYEYSHGYWHFNSHAHVERDYILHFSHCRL